MPYPRIRYSLDGTICYTYKPNSNTRENFTTANKQVLDGDLSKTDFVSIADGYYYDVFMANFPDDIIIDKIGIKHGYSGTITIKTSSNSIDGTDGTWTTVGSGSITANTYTEFTVTSSATRWLRVHHDGGLNQQVCYAIWIFGEYQNPRFELWNEGSTAKLNTTAYPLSYPTAYNDVDNLETNKFKIKNLTDSAKTYTVAIGAVRYEGDTTITNYTRVAEEDGDISWTTSLVTASVASGAFSNTIDAKLELTKANNLADGYHYFYVSVTEN